MLLLLAASFSSFTLKAQSDTTTLVSPDNIFTKVEIEAEFPGGLKAWANFLNDNLKSNVPVKRKAPVGQYTVIIKFIVDKSGEVRDVVAETSYGYGMEQEVIRVIKKSPNWKPAIQDGRKVNAYRRQPITFDVIK